MTAIGATQRAEVPRRSAPRAVGRPVAAGLALLAALGEAAAILLAVANRVPPLKALETYFASNLVIAATLAAVGTLLAVTRPRLPLGWYLDATALLVLIPPLAAQYARAALVTRALALPGGTLAAALAALTWPLGFVLVFAGLPLLFPDGLPPSRRWWPVAILGGAGAVLMAIGSGFTAGPSDNLPDIDNPIGVDAAWPDVVLGIGMITFLAVLVAAIVSLFVRYRRSDAGRRIQIRAFLAAAALLLIGEGVVAPLLGQVIPGPPRWLQPALEAVLVGALLGSVAVAVLRHRLHDIDLVVHRGAVYGTMTVFVVAVYVVVVEYCTAALGLRGVVPQLLATALVAVLFHPARQRVQRGIDRLFWGERHEPTRLLAQLHDRLVGAESVDSVLAAVTSTLRQGLRLQYVELTMRNDEGGIARMSDGAAAGPLLTTPLVWGGHEVGMLSVAPRRGQATLGKRDRAVLLEYARQAAPAAYAARLTGELLGARARLVLAGEAERQRLRRDLHDGLGADLASQAITLDAARQLLRADPARVEQLLVDLRDQVQDEVRELRRILHGLRPESLDDHGLAAALATAVHRTAGEALATHLSIDLDAPLAPAVEVAVLRIVTEAVANSVRHSGGTTCWITVAAAAASAEVTVVVRDDGRGLGDGRGVGLRSMRERAAELGGSVAVTRPEQGGVLVTARLPGAEAT